jgi:hypothetical protein
MWHINVHNQLAHSNAAARGMLEQTELAGVLQLCNIQSGSGIVCYAVSIFASNFIAQMKYGCAQHGTAVRSIDAT